MTTDRHSRERTSPRTPIRGGNWTSEKIRETFLSYFESKGHSRMASSSLIPVGDPTLLFTSAGMVQFKSYFTGETEPPNRRLTTSQKCFRTPDIEEVGDATHNTLFEMLGNFSIGDYFKTDAVDFAIELMTQGYGIPLEKFAAAVHDTDDETRELWVAKGIPRDRVYSYGDDENWWGPAGDEGPCGPCSELHYDYGPGNGCLEDDCAPNCKHVMDNSDVCDRYVELWNLVFMQFYHHLDGSRTDLPAPSVDTGMGFERLIRIMQSVDTGYDTDLFTPIVAEVERISGRTYGEDQASTYGIRVVAEHGRSVTFLIADGVVPANEGRGYVLRRVIRRAIRYARRIGIEGNFLGEIADVTIEKMGEIYPELINNRDFIKTVLRLEEDRFQQAFQNGYAILSEALDALAQEQDLRVQSLPRARTGGVPCLPGDVVFRLWDTHGFPVEMTQEIAAENDVEIDMEGFEREMAAQREQSRAGAQFGEDRAKIRVYESLGVGGTAFLGYESLRTSTVVVGLIVDDLVVNEVSEGQNVEIVLLQTPFYAEGGGQIGDTGDISGDNGRIAVTDTQEVMPGLIVQFGKVARGSVSLGETVDAYVDPDPTRGHCPQPYRHTPAARRSETGARTARAPGRFTGRSGPPALRLHPCPASHRRRDVAGAAPGQREGQAERPRTQRRGHLPGGDQARCARLLRRPLRRARPPRRDSQRRNLQLRGLRWHPRRTHRRGRGGVRARRVQHRRRHEAHRGHQRPRRRAHGLGALQT